MCCWVQSKLHALCLVTQPAPLSLILELIWRLHQLPYFNRRCPSSWVWHIWGTIQTYLLGKFCPGKGQKCIVACTCRSWTINSAKRIDSKHTPQESRICMKTARSYLSTDFRTHREGMRGQKPYLSISDRFCILGQKTQSLGKILLQHAACQSMTSKGLNVKL